MGVYSGSDGERVFSGLIRCKKWSCPHCGPRKLSQLRKRLLHGDIAVKAISKYGLKFATLTFGGNDIRSAYIITERVPNPLDPSQMIDQAQTIKWATKSGEIKEGPLYDVTRMYEDMMSAFNVLLTSLKKKYGKFQYFRIHEPHQDGVPHLHVLFAGSNCIPKDFYSSIQKLWSKYGFGFVKLNTIKDKNGRTITKFNDAQHAVNYLLKYMTKGLKTAGKYKRVFSCSKNALMPVQKKEWETMIVIMGQVNDNGDIVEEIVPEKMLKEAQGAYLDYKHGENDWAWKKPDIVNTIMGRHINALRGREAI